MSEGIRGAPAGLLMRAAEQLLLAANAESDVLAVAMDLLGAEFGYGMRYVLLYDPAADELAMARAAGPASDLPAVTAFRVARGAGLTGTCAATMRIVNVPDVRADPRYLSVIPECVSEICVPVHVRDELLGVLSLQSPRAGAFTVADEDLLGAFAQLVALALLHARALRARAADIAELQALNEVARVATGLDLDRTLQSAVDVFQRLTASDSTVICLYDPGSHRLQATALRFDPSLYPADYPERVRDHSLGLGEGIIGWAAEHREAVLIDDSEHDPRVRALPGIPLTSKSTIAVPLLVEERMYGVIRAVKKGIKSYTDQQFRLAQTIASQAALAIAAARAHQDARRLAMTDELTGLFNARHFRERLLDEVRRAERYAHDLALLVIDSDALKRVNDQLGHGAGDLVLVRLARSIGSCVRSTDIAARYGGDEFVVLQPETHAKAAVATAERIRNAAHGSVGDLDVTVSIGVACYPHDADGADALFAAGDRALYEAKRRGKDRVVALS